MEEQKKFAAKLVRALVERHGKTFGDEWLVTWEFPGYLSINYLVDPEAYIAVDIESHQGYIVVDARYGDEVLSACEHRVIWSGNLEKDVAHWKKLVSDALSDIYVYQPSKSVQEDQELEALRAFKLDIGLKLVAIENALKTASAHNTRVNSKIKYTVADMLNTYFNPCPNNRRRE